MSKENEKVESEKEINCEIRYCRDEDDVLGLYRRVFAEKPWNENWTDDSVTSLIRKSRGQKNSISLVAVVDNKIVGFRFAYELPMAGFEFLDNVVKRPAMFGYKIGVDSDYRRKGIARRMMIRTFARAHALGYVQMVGCTKNLDAMGPLYDELGYNRIGNKDPKNLDKTYFIKGL